MVYEIPGQNGLTARQNKFVDAWVAQGRPGNATQCAELAGYGKAGAHVTASRLLRHPGVLAEIRRRAISTLTSEVVNCVNTMTLLRDGPGVDDAVRLKAATSLLDRAIPLARLHQIDINVTVEPSRESTLRELIEIYRRRGEPLPPYLTQAQDFYPANAFASRPRQKIIEHEADETEIPMVAERSGA
jgi:hypothetical protein